MWHAPFFIGEYTRNIISLGRITGISIDFFVKMLHYFKHSSRERFMSAMLKIMFLLNLKWVVRDKMLQALLGVALFLIILVPAISSFSMRQVQELAVTLSLSVISLMLLVFSTFLGGASVWRDIEKRYTSSVTTLPMSRGLYLLGKFMAIALFLAGCALFLGLVSAAVIWYSSAQYPSSTPILWPRIGLAIFMGICKYVLLAALAILFSSISTSFFLPFFGTIAVYLAGSASQEVFEYVSGDYGKKLGAVVTSFIKGVYYLIPNFGSFDYTLYAIYPLSLEPVGLCYTLLYFCVYTIAILALAIWTFSRRELP